MRKFSRQSGGDSHRSSDTARLWLLFGPLVFVTSLIRLLETTMLRRGAMTSVDSLLWTNGPLPFLCVLLGLTAFWIVRRHTPLLPVLVPVSVATTIAAAAATLGRTMAPWWVTGWLSPQTFEVLRSDLLLILVLLSAVVFVLATPGTTMSGLARATAHLLVPLIMTVSMAGFGYFLATGSPADWQITKYALSNFSDIRELVAGSLQPHHAALLLLPWLWSGSTWLSLRKRRHAGVPNLRPASTLSLAPLIVVLAIAPHAELIPSIHSGSLHEIVRTAALDLTGPGTKLGADPYPTGNPDFDAERLRMVPTDSTVTPNLVLVLMESVRSRSTTPYESGLNTMPFLDSLGHAGATVDEMYAVVSYTNKELLPIYAGVYPRPGRDIVEATPHAIPGNGMPSLLRPFGYRTAFFTPATLEFERKDVILRNLGFDHMAGADELPTDGFHKKAYFGYEDRAIIGPAVRWAIEASAGGRPFFLNVLTLTSHHPYDTPPTFPQRDFATGDHELNDYYNSLRYTDHFIRDLVGRLKEAGLLSNTIVMIMGDHGEAFSEHMEKTHGNVVWDEALQVPAILFAPGRIPAGARIAGPRQHIDILPTVADLLNVDLVDGFLPGRSLLAAVSPHRVLYHHSLDDGRAMVLRRDSLKFIYRYRQAPTQVFNYIDDPLERIDIASTFPAEVLSGAELELMLWRKRVSRAYPDRRRVRRYPTVADSSNVAGPRDNARWP